MSLESPTLVLFAAGLGTRFGGDKQWTALGPSGQRLLDYTLHDAILAGFRRALLVIRPGAEPMVRSHVAPTWSDRLHIDLAVQSLDALPTGFSPPPGRTKPWGTGHALWCALPHLAAPFCVANADDFYGRDALRQARALLDPIAAGTLDAAIVAYPLRATLSSHGGVSRGLCHTDSHGHLVSLSERTGIALCDGRLRADPVDEPADETADEPASTQATPHELAPEFSPDAPVSMNLLAFAPAVRHAADHAIGDFFASLHEPGHDPLRAEFPITAILNRLVADRAAVQVALTDSPWMGVTFARDAEHVRHRLLALHRDRTYPDVL